MISKVLINIFLLCIFKFTEGQERVLPNHLVADPNGTYHIFWLVHDENITIEVQVKHKGFVGFGFSPNGGMPGADIVICRVLPNGTPFFEDRHAVEFALPLLDEQQNYHLISASENDTHTICRFTRKLNTCDKDGDRPITDDTQRIIYSWNPDDPNDSTRIRYHGKNRGAKQVYLISPQPPQIEMSEDITTWDIKMPNVTIPAQLTTYWCFHIKIPNFTVPHYYLGYNVIITPGNEHLVHHFLLFECRGNKTFYEERIRVQEKGYQCFTSGIIAPPVECQPSLLVWAVGASGQTLPPDVGVAFGEENGGPDYFYIQIHYANSELKQGIIDSTNLRLYLTKKTVKHTAGMLEMYANVDYTMVVPPQQPEYNVITYCPAQCTANALPPGGVTIFAAGLHTHLAGVRIYARHFRGKKELKPIAFDDYYAFNYQEVRHLKELVILLPGDTLMGHCVYSTMKRNDTILGGYGTDDEMCFFYLYFYPAVPLTLCISGPTYEEVREYFGVEELGPDLVTIVKPASLANQSIFTYEKNFDWSKVDAAKFERMKRMQFDAPRNVTCYGDPTIQAQTTIAIGEYPKDAEFYEEPDVCLNVLPATQKAEPNPYKPDPYQPDQYEPDEYHSDPYQQDQYPPKPKEYYRKAMKP